jgi:hypothetical protein
VLRRAGTVLGDIARESARRQCGPYSRRSRASYSDMAEKERWKSALFALRRGRDEELVVIRRVSALLRSHTFAQLVSSCHGPSPSVLSSVLFGSYFYPWRY